MQVLDVGCAVQLLPALSLSRFARASIAESELYIDAHYIKISLYTLAAW